VKQYDLNPEHYCRCGKRLSDKQLKVIERLRASSARVFARGLCDTCWDIDNPEEAAARKIKEAKKEAKRGQKRARQETTEDVQGSLV
jgi:hypothetical protein